MRVLRPATVNEALEMLAGATSGNGALLPIAGATDLFVSWHHQPRGDIELLDLSHLCSELQGMRLTPTHLELGALTTYWDVISSSEVAEAFPLLAQAARQVGAFQIQTRGTWAGNIANASPAADGVLALMVYDATVVLRSRFGQSEHPLDRYYTGYKQTLRQPDQLIVGIRVPRRVREFEWIHKVGSRAAQTITKVGVAVVKDECGWCVVANSVAPYVCRCRTLEAVLGKNATFNGPDEILRLLADNIAPIDDIRSTARYRATVLSRLLYYWLLEHPHGVGTI